MRRLLALFLFLASLSSCSMWGQSAQISSDCLPHPELGQPAPCLYIVDQSQKPLPPFRYDVQTQSYVQPVPHPFRQSSPLASEEDSLDVPTPTLKPGQVLEDSLFRIQSRHPLTDIINRQNSSSSTDDAQDGSPSTSDDPQDPYF